MVRILRWMLLTCVAGIASTVGAGAQDLEQIKTAKWATVHGGIGAALYQYGVSGIAPRRVPTSWVLTGQATLSIKGFEMPFSFQLSEQSRDFRQPFNQFGLSPKYKWVQVHLGYRNLSYSRYTLDGHTFLGAGIDLHPGKFRFGAMYGRFLRAVQEDSARQVYNSLSQYPVASYDRYGHSVRVGYGTDQSYVDLIYFKGKDDSNSVRRDPEYQQVAPQENVAVGIKANVKIVSRLTLEADAALSVLTRDQRADTVALEDVGWQKVVKSILQPRLSTNLYYGGEGGLAWRDKQYALALKYSRIMPDYRTMGIYYLQTDLERYLFSPSYNGKKGKFNIAGSLGIEHDNVEKKKLAQSNRLIGSVSANFNPSPKWGVSLQYANFGISQRPGLRAINDTIRLEQVSNSITVSPRYSITNTRYVHNLSFIFSDQVLSDRNKFNNGSYNSSTINNTLSYVIYLVSRGLTVDASAYHVQTTISAGKNVSVGGSAGASKNFLKNKLSSGLNLAYSSNSFNNSRDGSTLQMRTTHTYAVNRQHRFRLDFVFTNNTSVSGFLNRSFSEHLLTLMYNFTF